VQVARAQIGALERARREAVAARNRGLTDLAVRALGLKASERAGGLRADLRLTLRLVRP